MAATESTGASPTALVGTAAELLHHGFFEPLKVETLLAEAWEGAAAALGRAGVVAPPAPAYPADPAAARRHHDERFPELERLAAGRLDADELAAAALRELAARRRDGHTALFTPRMQARWRSMHGRPRADLGLVLSGAAPLAVADLVPGGPAQRAGLRRGQTVLSINGQPCADLPRVEASALFDLRAGAANELVRRDHDGRDATVVVRGEPRALITATVLPGPVGLLRVDGFAFTPEETAELRAALTAFEEAGARGWIVDVRWCGGGVSIGLSRLLVDRGRLFARVRHDVVDRPDLRIPAREDIDADGSALPFQRPLVVLTGPGSISGAESFAGPLQALGRARLVGERTAGLCGTGPGFDLAPGWVMAVTTRQTVFGPDERRYNRVGVPPDVSVAPTFEDDAAGRDPRLEAALDVLRAA
jgi:carboxyl-terminal processing protease